MPTEIETGIPLPPRQTSTRMKMIRHLLNEGKKGDSIFIHGLSSSAAHGYAYQVAGRSGFISCRSENSGVRVWKIK